VLRLAGVVLRHRALVAGCWLLVLVAGGATAGTTTSRLTFDFSLPGQPGYETEQALLASYGNGADQGTTVVAVTVPAGSTVRQEQPRVDGVFRALQQQFPRYRVVWGGNAVGTAPGIAADAPFGTADGRTAYGLVTDERVTGFAFRPAFVQAADLLAEQARTTGFAVATTGYVQLSQGSTGDAGSGPPSVLSETLLGAAGALLILVFVFASFLALVPLLVAAVSILATFLCVLALTSFTDISFIVQFLVALVGLGVAIDYSLLVVTRWREEREHGRDNAAAVVEAVRTAGSAVIASAGTVAISLLALVALPVPFLRSMGIGGMLIPLVSAAVVLTLLPAILGSIGPRVDWPRVRHETAASRAWSAWARLIYRRRVLAAGVGLVLVGALVVPVFGIRIGQARTESLAATGPAVQTLGALRDGGAPAGLVTPLDVLMAGDDPTGSAREVVRRLAGVDGVAFAAAPDDPTWRVAGTAVVTVLPQQELVDLQRAAVVERVRQAAAGVPGFVGVAGPGATVLDYDRAVFGNAPLAIALIALTTFVLLVRTFRSLLLPLKAVLLNVVSAAATFGFVVLFWQLGYGSQAVFGVQATGAVTFWLPVLIFAFLFGLSMDYEVFILARMREEFDRTGSTRTAVVEGLGRTGRLVTSAALILFWAFIALASAPGTDVKVIATALGVGILIDATVVRALLVPALVSLLGRWNWWLPAWLARPLRVDPSPAVREPVALPGPRAESATTTEVPR